ncbi:SIMPL domain-containing protein [Parasphaerochaeta coccoides]|uniref:DUF541 domain-containing protein n=1 Tax=Parasphaerochaeta coccoides (strain ATCC BAA-1237 / DSM 17374 / SPN1) TaxID=760011 RepID=F4GM39_PARC1|nr:SIMPL domain-containing protein [Parasphaerochaeta coccoides]AEC02514.1 protein of unknown function DUF541 [Parasphaerochaeta coccoides DSM 17374]
MKDIRTIRKITMRKISVVAFAVLAIVVLAGCSSLQGNVNASATSTIEVSGTAVVKVAPDVASFTVGVTHRAPTSAEAQDVVIEKMGQILTLVKNAGVLEKDIVTTALDMGPEYEWRDNIRVTVGQRASQRISVTYRLAEDSDGLGGLLAALGRIDAIEISSVRFGRDDEEAALSDARAKAMGDALSKASDYAAGAGRSVGRALRISETNSSTNFLRNESLELKTAMPMMASADAYAPVELPTGEIEISATVYVVYVLD